MSNFSLDYDASIVITLGPVLHLLTTPIPGPVVPRRVFDLDRPIDGRVSEAVGDAAAGAAGVSYAWML
jgi:hypothetical protein